jgi:hypothetical protein
MKHVPLLIILLLAGCATPSRVIESYDVSTGKSILKQRITEYHNSTFASGKQIGLKVGYDFSSYSPVVKIIYGRYESARIDKGMCYDSDYGLRDVNFFSGAGAAKHHIKVGPVIKR